MTIDEAIKDLEYGSKQLEMEIKSGLWIKGSESELRCKEGITLNKQHIEWLKELKNLREENKALIQKCDKLIKEKGADVQPVSTIKKLQEHIKQRILETAFNNGGIYREVAEDIADRIDIWVDEFGGLKMADLIERYKITANLPSVMMNYCNRFNSKQIESITEMIYELENSIESADVQPVVHCKDCKHRKERQYEESGEKPYIKYECKFTKYSMSDKGFCSFGTRMDGDAE